MLARARPPRHPHRFWERAAGPSVLLEAGDKSEALWALTLEGRGRATAGLCACKPAWPAASRNASEAFHDGEHPGLGTFTAAPKTPRNIKSELVAVL